MALNCAIQSYDHKLYLGLTADAAAAPDVARLRNFLDEAFASLKKAAGLGASKRKPAKAKASSPNFTAPPEQVYKGLSSTVSLGTNGGKAAVYS
jgi:hypothetical protein